MSYGTVFECHLNIEQPNLLNTTKVYAIFFSYVLVLYFNGRWSIQDIAHKPTIWIPNHLKSDFQKVRYSNVSSIQMVFIQILTLVGIWKLDIQIPETSKTGWFSSPVFKCLTMWTHVESFGPLKIQTRPDFGSSLYFFARCSRDPNTGLVRYSGIWILE